MPPERPRRGGRTRRDLTTLVVVRDPRAIAVLIALVVAMGIAHNIVLVWHGALGLYGGVRPLFDVVAVLGACVAGDRFGNVRVLSWTAIGAMFAMAIARLVPVAEATAGLVIVAEACLVGSVPLCVLIAQDLRWVSRALVTGLVFGVRYWSDYAALFLVRFGSGEAGASSRMSGGFDGMVVLAAALVAVAYVLSRVFERIAPPPVLVAEDRPES